MKLPHIIFLDFDGPLFSSRALMLPENNEFAENILKELKLHPLVSYWKFDPVAVAMLHELYRFRPYQLVISSTWGNVHDKTQIERLFKANGLGAPMHKKWNTFHEEGSNRASQIRHWLDNNEYSDYLIIDDNESGAILEDIPQISRLNLNREQIMIVDTDEGLLYRDFYRLKAIMANWN